MPPVVPSWEVDFDEPSELKPASVNLDYGNSGTIVVGLSSHDHRAENSWGISYV